jgi:hypothetical protein
LGAHPDAINTPVTLNVATSHVPLGTTVSVRVAPAICPVHRDQWLVWHRRGLFGAGHGDAAAGGKSGHRHSHVQRGSRTISGYSPTRLPLIDQERPQQIDDDNGRWDDQGVPDRARGSAFEVGAAAPVIMWTSRGREYRPV